MQRVTAVFSLGVKRPGREADDTPSSSADVKECMEIYIHSPSTPSWRGAQFKAQGQLYLLYFTCIDTYNITYTFINAHKYMRGFIIHTHTHVHTSIHTYIHTYTHTHTHIRCLKLRIFEHVLINKLYIEHTNTHTHTACIPAPVDLRRLKCHLSVYRFVIFPAHCTKCHCGFRQQLKFPEICFITCVGASYYFLPV
jgi:hypothetical protein